VIRLLLLQPKGQGLPHGLRSGDSPLAAEGIQLLAGGFGEIDDRAHGKAWRAGPHGIKLSIMMTLSDVDDGRSGTTKQLGRPW
jgi:hypothetical protein